MLLKLIFFGVAKGDRGSRKLAEKAARDLRGMMLCGGLRPSARTISRFIQRNQDEIEDLFVQVLKIRISLGMVEFGHTGAQHQAHLAQV
jgi:transposase